MLATVDDASAMAALPTAFEATVAGVVNTDVPVLDVVVVEIILCPDAMGAELASCASRGNQGTVKS